MTRVHRHQSDAKRRAPLLVTVTVGPPIPEGPRSKSARVAHGNCFRVARAGGPWGSATGDLDNLQPPFRHPIATGMVRAPLALALHGAAREILDGARGNSQTEGILMLMLDSLCQHGSRARTCTRTNEQANEQANELGTQCYTRNVHVAFFPT